MLMQGSVLQTNNIIVGNETHVVLIESSVKLEKLKQAIGNRTVVAILLTHGHWDHYEQLQSVAEALDVPIYLTQEAHKKLLLTTRTMYMKVVPIDLPIERFVFIKEGQVLDFGFEQFLVIETPGHTNCSVSFLIRPNQMPALLQELNFNQQTSYDGAILLSGDTLFLGGQGRTDLPTGSQEDIEQSLQKLFLLPSELLVVPGHGKTTQIGKERF